MWNVYLVIKIREILVIIYLHVQFVFFYFCASVTLQHRIRSVEF